ncbi:hypothetical protein [Pontibacter sp. BAB1700]|uniref:hypothetical protein n=1 Tax=Pontibacter sp. BAB1700 TaxID=1144253 RepID=UPI00026BC9C8|nr:hypothetical protein [Pontibacter sp. BAB1700]EJF09708.1 hypothetical protein O71_13464 [Pontibacter sp. BAB1700]
MKDRNHRLGLLVHVLTVFVLLLKGADKLSQQHVLSGGFFVGLGILIILLLILEKVYHWSHRSVKIACFLIESAALAVMAIVFYQEGKQYLPYVFGLSATAYLIIALASIFRKGESTQH